MKTVTKRIEALEATTANAGNYENWSSYRDHATYVVGNDGSLMDIPKLSTWPDEAALWESYPAGTKLLRLSKAESPKEVIDRVASVVRFAPIEMAPDARRALDELYHDIVGEWPDRGAEVAI